MGQEALAATEKRARRQNALIVFEDESGVSLLPSVRATWAPRGQTPVLRHRFAWKRLSMAGALAYEPDGSDAHLVFQLRPGAYNDETLIEFLTEVHQHERALGAADLGRTALASQPTHAAASMQWLSAATRAGWESCGSLDSFASSVENVASAPSQRYEWPRRAARRRRRRTSMQHDCRRRRSSDGVLPRRGS